MQLKHGIHLGYCTNIHRGETWGETFAGLDQFTRRVREQVCAADEPYGIGLRLSADAAAELATDRSKVDAFRRWLEETNSYVFTINGFPYGKFHNTRVKEQVYAPDWTTRERLDYTTRLFDLLCEIAPAGIAGSVSTLPGSFKEFITDDAAQGSAICANLRACSEHLERLRESTGRDLHLGLEPEPLGWFETTPETVRFFDRLTDGVSDAERQAILRNIGVNYDTCHLAIEYEEPAAAIGRLRNAGIRVSKIHLSSALKLAPSAATRDRLRAFEDDVYLHQVVVREGDAVTRRFRDLPDALDWAEGGEDSVGDEWRVHFHVPVHAQPETAFFSDTRDHVSGVLELLGADPGWCDHFEMETYTWEVLPPELRSPDVVDQLVKEYDWCLGEFERVGLR
ncbi:MAG: metabolite traffic protein EboE [Verrucomicrobiae bacterium]|nr:metabolite traffic protein EboE [Verrucomicrobiae bacterium]